MGTLTNSKTKLNLEQSFGVGTDSVFGTLCVLSLLIGNLIAGIPSTIYGRQFGPTSWNTLMMISWAGLEFLNLLFNSDTFFWMSQFLIGGIISWLHY